MFSFPWSSTLKDAKSQGNQGNIQTSKLVIKRAKKCIFQTKCLTDKNLGFKDVANQESRESIQFVGCFFKKKKHLGKKKATTTPKTTFFCK